MYPVVVPSGSGSECNVCSSVSSRRGKITCQSWTIPGEETRADGRGETMRGGGKRKYKQKGMKSRHWDCFSGGHVVGAGGGLAGRGNI